MIPIFIQGDDMALKYSRQREVIKDCLINREDHPTADMVYMEVRETFPNISLGTVYRNLQLLTDLGEIQKLNVGTAWIISTRKLFRIIILSVRNAAA